MSLEEELATLISAYATPLRTPPMVWQRATPQVGRGNVQMGQKPPLINPADAVHYAPPMSGWSWYNQRLIIRDEGWKLHVSGNAQNAPRLYAAVLPVLRQHNYAHKVMLSYNEIARQVGDQHGKILAVYPDDIAQAFQIVQHVDQALASWTRASSPQVAHELAVGNTVVYTRYGAYNEKIYNPDDQKYVPDTRGQLKPDWIQNPWPHYPNAGALAAFAPWPTHTQQGRAGRGNRRH